MVAEPTSACVNLGLLLAFRPPVVPDTPYVVVPLTRGLTAKVDPPVADTVLAHRWFASVTHRRPGGEWYSPYAARNVPAGNGKRTLLRLHNWLLPSATGYAVDHINRDTLDNRRCNMRVVPSWINQLNRAMGYNNVAGEKGVFRPYGTRYYASIHVAGRTFHLGVFDRREEARHCYDTANHVAIAAWYLSVDPCEAVADFRAAYCPVRVR